jgi:hypothetical protein
MTTLAIAGRKRVAGRWTALVFEGRFHLLRGPRFGEVL